MKYFVRILLGAGLLTGCAGITHEPLVTIDAAGFKPSSSPMQDQYRRLRAAAENREGAREAIQDILAAMEAVQSEEQNLWETAAKQWLLVLKNDGGAMASMAFPRWIKVQERLAVAAVPADVLARLLFAQTRDGQDAPWLKKQNLTDLGRLTNRIKELQGEVVKGGTPLPLNPRDIKDDPVWEKAARLSCRKELPDTWRNWVRSMSPDQKLYWDGLQASCRMDYTAAIAKYEQALPLLRLNLATWPYAINSAERLVMARKSLGQREEATRAYQQLADLLNQSETLSASPGWSQFEIWRKRVDTWYWVARSQALQGDYQNAKIAVHEGLKHLAEAQTMLLNPSEKQSQALNDLKAEGYNILASRIAYEEKDLTAALSLTRMGQDVPGISDDWKQRLNWSEAWFAYVMNDRGRALRVWQSILEGVKDEQQKPRYYYWIGRALHESGRTGDAAEYFAKLKKEAPLSFYTIVGLPRIDKKYAEQNLFGSTSRLESRLRDRNDFPWDAYRTDKEAERRLVRLELMLAANVTTWLEPISGELFRYVNSKGVLLKDVEASLYVTRLLHMAGAYLPAISLTTQLSNQVQEFWSNYPEQILIFFPRPYLDIYQRAATQSYIDIEIPLAISRQESSFQADAVSPAEAMGLMQLMSNTAQRQAGRLGLRIAEPETELKRPELNIVLGSAYLAELGRRYRGQWQQAFAAYNAGEYVVDAWLQRRAADDPLLWIEALSFAETSSYAKNVWRNWEVYRWLLRQR